VYDASYGLYSDTQSKKQTQLAKTMTDLESQIVQGNKPVSAWTAAVQTWKSSGGDKMRGELEQAFSDAAAGK
jgi:putative aldouronate transport system substrate-binding protein